ncbi:MAG TPA: hypothetical protein VHC22_14235 [Pirellulales bacterium]|nr:hypothetical protein [Pirellulales bacterium]
MIEIYYSKPVDSQRETSISERLAGYEGKVTYREDDSHDTICLTAEFNTWENAQAATTALRLAGEHVEGPSDYGENWGK